MNVMAISIMFYYYYARFYFYVAVAKRKKWKRFPSDYKSIKVHFYNNRQFASQSFRQPARDRTKPGNSSSVC